jgi:hypothetical protein
MYEDYKSQGVRQQRYPVNSVHLTSDRLIFPYYFKTETITDVDIIYQVGL